MHTLEQLRSGQLAGCRRLALQPGLDHFPPEIYTLADTLEVLDLSGQQLSSLPDDLPRLTHLKVLFASGNPFTELPAVLGRCAQLEMIGFKACRIEHVPAAALPPQLRWLILTDNRIEALPAELGRCLRLRKLMLAGNRLRELPDLSGCTELELLRLAANRIKALPDWLLQLPRLAWLALAGNPLWSDQSGAGDRLDARPDITRIRWSDLQLEHTLGAGASGVIHRAAWQPAGAPAPHPVAVKLFRAAMTSDGLPECEMAACIAAAGHAGLIEVEGVLQEHPDGAAGLVLALLDPSFRALAGPPSLASCTRDVYADELRLPVAAVRQIAHRVADATAHLHACGLLHGDLYAHNLLWNGDAAQPQVLLSDFGAATLHDRSGPQAAALQRIEARAFGILLGELIERAVVAGPAEAADATDTAELARLAELRDAAVQPQVSQRPDLATLRQALA